MKVDFGDRFEAFIWMCIAIICLFFAICGFSVGIWRSETEQRNERVHRQIVLSSVYPTTLKVTEIRNLYFKAETSTGFEYEIKNPEDLDVGDYISVIMDANGTEDIRDDEVIQFRYAGW